MNINRFDRPIKKLDHQNGFKAQTLATSFRPISLNLIFLFHLALAGLFARPLLSESETKQSEKQSWNNISPFMDQVVNRRMKDGGIPGGVVTIVKDCKVVHSRGYGMANVEKKIPVSAKTSLFRIASISKTFTATAAVQLAERGQLDLHADIETYLGEKGPVRSFKAPISVHHLLTHTAGFDLSDIADAAREVPDITPLSDLARSNMTAQTTPPGAYFRYSNRGISLVGAVIEQATHKPFHQYMHEELFAPLAMNNTTVQQPAPAHLLDNIALGYKRGNQPLPFDYSNVAPADAMLTSGDDMGRYMLFQMGYLAGAEAILSKEGLNTLQSQQFSNQDPTWLGTWHMAGGKPLSGVNAHSNIPVDNLALPATLC
jgi:CubicO group peptidase (beta-lactamase class C family)